MKGKHDSALPNVASTIALFARPSGEQVIMPEAMPEAVRHLLETRYLLDTDQAAEIYAAIRDMLGAYHGDE